MSFEVIAILARGRSDTSASEYQHPSPKLLFCWPQHLCTVEFSWFWILIFLSFISVILSRWYLIKLKHGPSKFCDKKTNTKRIYNINHHTHPLPRLLQSRPKEFMTAKIFTPHTLFPLVISLKFTFQISFLKCIWNDTYSLKNEQTSELTVWITSMASIFSALWRIGKIRNLKSEKFLKLSQSSARWFQSAAIRTFHVTANISFLHTYDTNLNSLLIGYKNPFFFQNSIR